VKGIQIKESQSPEKTRILLELKNSINVWRYNVS